MEEPNCLAGDDQNFGKKYKGTVTGADVAAAEVTGKVKAPKIPEKATTTPAPLIVF